MNAEKSNYRKVDRAAVERSLRDLEVLFGRKKPAENDNTQQELGAGDTSGLGFTQSGGIRHEC